MSTRRVRKATPPRVLVVDDDADTREMYANALREAGYEVETAETGHEAIIAARQTQPEVVLMDLTMPVLDGWDAAQTLKSAPMTSAAWVIAVTARSERHDIDRAYAAGCDVVALKPIPPNEIVALVAAGRSRARAR